MQIAKTLQIPLKSKMTQNIQVEYLMPLQLKLNVVSKEKLLGVSESVNSILGQSVMDEHEHIEGYLPDGAE